MDINALSSIKIGCNAAYRNTDLDHLVCVDRGMLAEINKHYDRGTVWTRPQLINSHNQSALPAALPGNQRADHDRHWGSGPFAVLLAANMSNHIHMVGFDLYSATAQVNNVYKDTVNYSSSNSHAIDPRYWIYQISRIFATFPDKYFTVYNTATWQLPVEWQLPNVQFETLDRLYQL